MKKLVILFSVSLFLLSMNVQSQDRDSTTYFPGKWKVLLKGLPNGDTYMNFVIEKKDKELTGVVLDSANTEIAKLTKVEIKGFTAILYFSTQGYDVNLQMDKKDEDHVTGSLMGMFEAEGERVKK